MPSIATETFVMVSDEVVAPETQLTGPGHPPVFARLLNVEPPSVETCHWNDKPLAIVGVSVSVLVGQTFFEVMSVVTLGDVLTGTLTGVLATEQLDERVLRAVRVLVFVDEDVPEPVAIARQTVGMLFEEDPISVELCSDCESRTWTRAGSPVDVGALIRAFRSTSRGRRD